MNQQSIISLCYSTPIWSQVIVLLSASLLQMSMLLFEFFHVIFGISVKLIWFYLLYARQTVVKCALYAWYESAYIVHWTHDSMAP